MPRSAVNLRMVAKKAGVSATTVSSALSGRGRMTPALRQKIRRLATELGYMVDPILSAAMSQMRTRPEKRIESVIAWLEAAPLRSSVEDNPVLQVIWNGAHAQAKDMGYHLERFWMYEHGITPDRLARIFRARGIEGIIAVQYFPETAEPPPLDFNFEGFGCVSASTRLCGPDIHFAQADHFACTELALTHLVAHGYRRIGLHCPPAADTLTQKRVSSAYEGFMRHHEGGEYLPICVHQLPSEHVAFRKWIRTHKPDVVLGWITPGDIKKMGISVPEELGVCNLDYLPRLGDCAGVYQNHQAIGSAAIRLLHAQLLQGTLGIPDIPLGTIVEGRWVSGNSIRKMKPPARSKIRRK